MALFIVFEQHDQQTEAHKLYKVAEVEAKSAMEVLTARYGAVNYLESTGADKLYYPLKYPMLAVLAIRETTLKKRREAAAERKKQKEEEASANRLAIATQIEQMDSDMDSGQDPLPGTTTIILAASQPPIDGEPGYNPGITEFRTSVKQHDRVSITWTVNQIILRGSGKVVTCSLKPVYGKLYWYVSVELLERVSTGSIVAEKGSTIEIPLHPVNRWEGISPWGN